LLGNFPNLHFHSEQLLPRPELGLFDKTLDQEDAHDKQKIGGPFSGRDVNENLSLKI